MENLIGEKLSDGEIRFEMIDPELGEKMTLKDFLQCVDSGGFIDYDGFGHLATETRVSNIVVYPSMIFKRIEEVPSWATHIVWYNR